jgi:hypothetical protein
MTLCNIRNLRSLFAGQWAVIAVLGCMTMSGTLWAQKAATAAPVKAQAPVMVKITPHFNHPNSRSATFKNAPKLPSVAGCYHIAKGTNTWAKDTCLTPEYVKAHYPHPELEPGVQFTQAAGAKTSPIPVTGGAIDVGLQSIGSIDDPTWGKGYFSVQLNTNAFTDSSGHLSATQFVDMHKAVSATQSQDLVCIWNVDITSQQYPNTCHPELTGRAVRSGDFVAVQGYQDFQETGYLKMVFQLSWDSQEGTYGVVAQDQFGLTKTVNGKGNWNELTGSILGYGNGSKVNFTKTTLWVAIDAWNCEYDANTDCIAYDPGSWTWAATKPIVALWGMTEEQNNLTPSITYTNSTPASALPKLQCPGWNGCYIEYTETAP